jgi:hypothetical protein
MDLLRRFTGSELERNNRSSHRDGRDPSLALRKFRGRSVLLLNILNEVKDLSAS